MSAEIHTAKNTSKKQKTTTIRSLAMLIQVGTIQR